VTPLTDRPRTSKLADMSVRAAGGCSAVCCTRHMLTWGRDTTPRLRRKFVVHSGPSESRLLNPVMAHRGNRLSAKSTPHLKYPTCRWCALTGRTGRRRRSCRGRASTTTATWRRRAGARGSSRSRSSSPRGPASRWESVSAQHAMASCLLVRRASTTATRVCLQSFNLSRLDHSAALHAVSLLNRHPL